VRATFRTVGVLKAPVSLGSFVTANRPGSGSDLSMPMPMLWNFSSARFAPTWQAEQLPFVPKKISRPRMAASERGAAAAAALASA